MHKWHFLGTIIVFMYWKIPKKRFVITIFENKYLNEKYTDVGLWRTNAECTTLPLCTA